MNANELKEIANYMIGICLAELVKLGMVSREQVNGAWYSRCDLDARLDELGFAAAASIDGSGSPFIVFNSKINTKALACALPHEAIHLAQICSGRYEPFTGYVKWEGKDYPSLAADDQNYFSPDHQPWEAQAQELEHKIREALFSQIPGLKEL